MEGNLIAEGEISKYAWDCSMVGDQSVWAYLDLEDNLLLLQNLGAEAIKSSIKLEEGLQIEVDKAKDKILLFDEDINESVRTIKKIDDPLLKSKRIARFNRKSTPKENISITLEIFDCHEILLEYLSGASGSKYNIIKFESDVQFPIKDALAPTSLDLFNVDIRNMDKLKAEIWEDICSISNSLNQPNAKIYFKKIVDKIDYLNLYQSLISFLYEESFLYWNLKHAMENSSFKLKSPLIHLLLAAFDYYASSAPGISSNNDIQLYSHFQIASHHIPYLVHDGNGSYIKLNHFMLASSVQVNNYCLAYSSLKDITVYVTFFLPEKLSKHFFKIGQPFTNVSTLYMLRPGNVYRISQYQALGQNEHSMTLTLIDLNFEGSIIDSISYMNKEEYNLDSRLLNNKLLKDIIFLVSSNHNIQSLSLSHLNLGNQTSSFATIMLIFKKGNTSIISLNLSLNNLGVHQKNLEMLVECLKSSFTLKELYLDSNSLSKHNSNIIELSVLIKCTTSIKTLDLGTNQLHETEDIVFNHLIEAFAANKSIKTLVLDNNNLKKMKNSTKMIQSLASLSNIKFLSLYSNKLEESNFRSFPKIIM